MQQPLCCRFRRVVVLALLVAGAAAVVGLPLVGVRLLDLLCGPLLELPDEVVAVPVVGRLPGVVLVAATLPLQLVLLSTAADVFLVGVNAPSLLYLN